MTWTIINSIMSAILIPVIIYDSYIERKTQKMLNDAELEVKKYLTEVENHLKNRIKLMMSKLSLMMQQRRISYVMKMH
ncbi:hypothetical protein [Lactobacillus paragasseri]|uniref:hypothetical protein n=1 Tax=Lactobacillus paragasseri TaxID=2107999 RepID=UPI003B9A51EB